MVDRSTRVVITGIGLVTPLGASREASWSALSRGRIGARLLDMPGFQQPVAAFPSPIRFGLDEEPTLRLLDILLEEALADAAFPLAHFSPERIGVFIGSSKGGIRSYGRVADQAGRPGDDAALGRTWLRAWPGGGASRVARRLGSLGPGSAPVAACATGLIAVLGAADSILRGECDIAFAGSVDAALEPLILGAFSRMGALARVDDDPRRSVRPWDRRRSGFLVGEGGALFVLERPATADARGLQPYAEVAGGALGADAHHETALSPDPAGLAHVVRTALERSKVPLDAVDHINVHGTATRQNDPLESRALRSALGGRADEAVCSANKAQIGHLLGAAGSVELAFTALAMRDGFVPPTMNLADRDPECDLRAAPGVGIARPIRSALKLSIGFGGHLAAAVLVRPTNARTPEPIQ